jgi:hypothetical protein
VVEVARQRGDKPDTLLRVHAQAFTDARRHDEIRQRITQGTTIALQLKPLSTAKTPPKGGVQSRFRSSAHPHLLSTILT